MLEGVHMKAKKWLVALLAFALVVTVTASVLSTDITGYEDVPESYWAYSAIMDMTMRGMLSGTSTQQNGIGVFSPESPMTRAQFVSVLTRYLFADELAEMASAQPWYANNYTVSLKHGLLSSDELDNGDLTKVCTRQEMAVLLVRAAYIGNGEVATQLLPTGSIADYDSIAEQYQPYVLQAFSLGLLAGVDSKGTFNPTGSLSRAQAATVIYRLIDPSTRTASTSQNSITFTWEDGITYTGGYSDGEANGFGTMVFPDVGTYTGYFVNGKREGSGTFQWDVGDAYTGLWNNDAMCGEGTYTFADGYTITGTWANNRIATEAIFMEPSSLSLESGETANVVAKCTPEKITEFISWESSDPTVVSVTGSNNLGTLTAKSPGSATITATTDSGKVAVCTITVQNAAVQKISLNYGDYDLNIGSSLRLQATVLPTNASSDVTWTSSDSRVASVSASGYVTAKSVGTAVISAKAENGLIATCYVNVSDEEDDLWSGSWNVFTATARGVKTTSSCYGTCQIDIDNMTAVFSVSPYTGKYIDLAPSGSNSLAGCYESGSYGYEFTFYSITEQEINLEIKTIYDSTSGSDTVTINYYVLERS
jgi:uncharacterized protein YjdB